MSGLPAVTTSIHLVSPLTTMLQKLQWDSLQERRAHSRVIMLYHIRNGLVAIPASTYLQPEGPKPDTDKFPGLLAIKVILKPLCVLHTVDFTV